MSELNDFIVEAKAACYIGEGAKAAPSRQASHDLVFASGEWSYRDSYFGGTDFLGQETVWYAEEPVWAMNYYGRVLCPDLIDGAKSADVIRAALSAMYAEGRFLGGFEAEHDGFTYRDRNDGDLRSFTGIETISVADRLAFRLDYHGGMIVP